MKHWWIVICPTTRAVARLTFSLFSPVTLPGATFTLVGLQNVGRNCISSHLPSGGGGDGL